MRRRNKTVLLVLLAAGLAAWSYGCQGTDGRELPDSQSVLRLRITQSGQIVRLRENGLLAVHLPCGSKGGRWRLTVKPDRSVLRSLARHEVAEYEPAASAGPEQVFYLRGVAPGVTVVTLEREASPERFEVTVEVFY